MLMWFSLYILLVFRPDFFEEYMDDIMYGVITVIELSRVQIHNFMLVYEFSDLSLRRESVLCALSNYPSLLHLDQSSLLL